ncbi:hypothetical protein [Methylocystis bryophila]|uniref:Uncharacterized protein n=1 Tax=Methylocystis bryophila TaxID=655015 RepID=A0A1W6MWV8_9HYPH|nr:hypothetical protein [Methylocystis bryophila]ARN82009.1 hypothetical protein B1812_14005 [Methylocystis bryophila]BDV38119.1 hypothetical protein DSM21852_13720 [Methylocystis bryophila]
MSKLLVSEFGESPLPNPQHDLLARLYREIGVSAVAAALEVTNAPPAASMRSYAKTKSEPQMPAFLRDEKSTRAA